MKFLDIKIESSRFILNNGRTCNHPTLTLAPQQINAKSNQLTTLSTSRAFGGLSGSIPNCSILLFLYLSKNLVLPLRRQNGAMCLKASRGLIKGATVRCTEY